MQTKIRNKSYSAAVAGAHNMCNKNWSVNEKIIYKLKKLKAVQWRKF